MTDAEKDQCDYVDKLFDCFKQMVVQADLFKDKRINFFSITKMLTLEIKHSAFLGWLLDPGNEHKLKETVLKKLLSAVIKYVGDGSCFQNVLPNKDILSNGNIPQDVDDIVKNDNDSIRVDTEVSTGERKRMDLLIDIPETKTVIVIENKIDTDVHDDQLNNYQNEIALKYPDYNHIFIFLTKFGDVPCNLDGSYNSSWCILSYKSIRDTLSVLVVDLKKDKQCSVYCIGKNNKAEKADLLKILEDYIDMINTNILKTNPCVRQKCRDLLRNEYVQKAYEMLKEYEKIPTDAQIAEYVRERLGGVRKGRSLVWFTFDKIIDYFERRNGAGSYKLPQCRIVCQAQSKAIDAPIELYINIADDNNQPKELNQAQIDLLNKCGVSEKDKSGKLRHDIRLHSAIIIVDSASRGKTMDDLKNSLDAKIDEFSKNYLQPFLANL